MVKRCFLYVGLYGSKDVGLYGIKSVGLYGFIAVEMNALVDLSFKCLIAVGLLGEMAASFMVLLY